MEAATRRGSRLNEFAPTTRRAGPTWLRRLEWGIAAAVLGFLGWYLWTHGAEVATYPWSVDVSRLLAATACVIVAYSGFVLAWRSLLAAFGGDLTIVDAHRVWYLGNLGRYVPGKVLQVVGTAYMARSKGISPVVTVSASLAAQAFVVGVGLAFAAAGLPTVEGAGPWLSRRVGLAGATIVLGGLLSPILDAAFRVGLRLTGKIEYYRPIPYRARLAVLLAVGLAWAAFVAGWILFLTAISAAPAAEWRALGAILAMGYVGGWLTVFVPGGLGVREGVYAFLLALYIPGAVAVAVAVLARVWLTVAELAPVALLLARYGVDDLRAGGSPEPDAPHG